VRISAKRQHLAGQLLMQVSPLGEV